MVTLQQTDDVIQRPSIVVKAEREKKTQLPVCLWATPPTPTPHLCRPIREETDLPPKASASGRCWTPRGPEDTEEHRPHYQQDPGDTEEHQLVSQSLSCCCCCFIFPLAETLSLFVCLLWFPQNCLLGKRTKNKKQNSILTC